MSLRTTYHRVVCLALLAGCSPKLEPAGSCPVETATVLYSDPNITSIIAECTGCHSSKVTNRNGAPASINFDTYQEVVSYGEAADMSILGGYMPPNAPINPNKGCIFDAWVSGGYQQ